MNSEQNELFLTRVDVGGGKAHSPVNQRALLSQVRKEHVKIQEVVEAFRSKVDRMVDKQRQEYVGAYEHHIQDVQKELHQLREKANQIANDHTKNERTEKLKGDLNRYKTEALQLEADSDEIRVEMSHLVKQVYSVEKYRDWMLKKLRQAKREYTALIKERARLTDDQVSMSNGSAYTLDLANGNLAMKAHEQEQRFNRAMQDQATVHRQPTPSSARLPKINQAFLTAAVNPTEAYESIKQRKSYQGDIANQNRLAELITARARSEELVQFVRGCQASLHRRPFCKVERRDLDVILAAVEEKLRGGMNQQTNVFGQDEESLSLACELAASSQIYDTLVELISGHHQQVAHKNSPQNKNNHNILGNVGAEDDDEYFSDHHHGEHFADEQVGSVMAGGHVASRQPAVFSRSVGISLDNLDAFMPKL